MKTKSILFTTLCSLMLGTAFTSCDNEIEIPENLLPTEPVETYALIMYEGAWGGNNAGIAQYFTSTNKSMVSDLYYAVNGAKMGDLANAMVEDDDNIYVVVGGSKYVARLDKGCKELARHAFTAEEGEPRQIDVEDGYVYVTQQGGQVSKLDAETLDVLATFQGGDNLEGIVEENGKLYVANSYKGIDDYNKEVFIINASTMTLEKTLEVVENPNDMVEIDGTIYLLSAGNYADINPALQTINPNTGEVKTITNVSKITKGNDGLIYCVRSAYDANWNMVNTFFVYNPKAGEADESTSFLKDAPASFSTAAIYLLEVDEETGDIYVGTSDYVTNGTMYRFDANGNLKDTFDAGGINPSMMVFMD